ncbi:MAG: hypothetical protein RL682_2349 [Pseudomonadota bacterium]|jgi:uncharacterized surface protein with fasciclin (FAS1) repeats
MKQTALANTLAHTRRAALAAALLSLFAGCAAVSKPVSVADAINNTPTLSTLSSLVKSAGLTDILQGAGPLTVFAPNNEAFKVIPAKTMEALAKDPAALKNVLTFHVLPGNVMAASFKNSKARTLNGAEVELSKAGDMVTIDSAVVTQADLIATNGVVHIIDTVLMPPAKK